MKKLFFVFLIFIFSAYSEYSSKLIPPSNHFDLTDWKLQIPGPIEIKSLKNYASSYFFMTPENIICFNINASEKGSTKNSEYVRSELRHLLNWSIEDSHEIAATIKSTTDLKKCQVTVVQIHGITEKNENAPPLLRIVVENNNLYSYLKKDANGKRTEKTLLKSKIGDNFFTVDIKNENRKITIFVDGKEYLARDLSYWKYKNYYKVGCYPQAKEGNFKVYLKNLRVR